MVELQQGIYKHYKGKEYKLLYIGIHTETSEDLVVYQSLYDNGDYQKWSIRIRPKKMFLESVVVDGKSVPRFTYIWG